MTATNTIEDLLNKIFIQESGCWEFAGACNDKGYGTFWLNNVNHKTHRLAYEYYIGPIPDDLMVLHKCDNRRCCNPDHLFLGTNQDNMDDMMAKGRKPDFSGVNNSFAALSEDQVVYIRTSNLSAQELATKFRVDRSTINRARSRRTYSNVG